MSYTIPLEEYPVVKIIGVGGGGCAAVAHMQKEIGTSSWECTVTQYIALETDANSLRSSCISTSLLLGNHLCQGVGTAGNPELGYRAALADCERIRELLTGADLVAIVIGLGGGTGSGVAPLVAKLAQELNTPITMAVVTLPHIIEGEQHMRRAQLAAEALSLQADSLIVIPNDRLWPVREASYERQNNMMLNAVRHPIEMFTVQDMIGVDFADVRTVMHSSSNAGLGIGNANGKNRAQRAVELALVHPLLENIDFSRVCGGLIKITAGFDLSLDEFGVVSHTLRTQFSCATGTLVIGVKVVPEMQDMCVTMLLTQEDGSELTNLLNNIRGR